MTKKANDGKSCISGVRCQVENCSYHGAGNVCTAGKIDVRNEDALTKAETFCGTFTPSETWN